MARRTVEEVRAEIQAECRVVGISADRPTDEQLRARRREIVVTVGGVGIGLAALTVAGFRGGGLASPILRVALVLLGGFLAAYAFQKRKHLRRIDELKVEMGELQARTGQRVIEHVVYSELDDGLRTSLVVEDTLDGLLDSAVELLGARSGVLHLVRDGSHPTVWSRFGAPVLDAGPVALAATVARECTPELVDDEGRPARVSGTRIAAPLLHDGEVVAVVEVQADEDTSYDMVDLELLSRFCASAAGALDGSVLVAEARDTGIDRPMTNAGTAGFVSQSDDYF